MDKQGEYQDMTGKNKDTKRVTKSGRKSVELSLPVDMVTRLKHDASLNSWPIGYGVQCLIRIAWIAIEENEKAKRDASLVTLPPSEPAP